MKRLISLLALCVLLATLGWPGMVGAGEVLYETTFSADDFEWEDWETELDHMWDDRTPIGTFWYIDEGNALTVDWDAAVPAEVIVLRKGYEWTDYRAEFELEILVWGISWLFRVETPEDYELYAMAADDPGWLTVWPRVWGMYEHRYDTVFEREIELATVYRVVYEVEGNVVRHYVEGELVDEFDGVMFDHGTVGFRVAPGTGRLWRVHSLRVTEL